MQNNLGFVTKGIDLSKLGFKLEDKKMYESLISPFAEDQQSPHPFKMVIPESFKSFQFSVEKIEKKNLTDQILIYIFYNVLDQKMQLFAAQILMNDRKHRLHKKLRVWVKQAEQGPIYFNITVWKYLEFKEKGSTDGDYYVLKDFLEQKSE